MMDFQGVPQAVGQVCWMFTGFFMMVGLVRTTGGQDRSKLAGDNQPLVNTNLAIVTSDFWTFAIVSAIASLGLACAFAEKLLVYDELFNEDAGLSAETIKQKHSAMFSLNLWFGVLVKTMAVSNTLYDLFIARRVAMSLGHMFADMLEALLFLTMLWRYENMCLPLEKNIINAGAAASQGQTMKYLNVIVSGEAMIIQLFVCLILSVLSGVIPMVRHYLYCANLHKDQTAIAVRIVAQQRAERLNKKKQEQEQEQQLQKPNEKPVVAPPTKQQEQEQEKENQLERISPANQPVSQEVEETMEKLVQENQVEQEQQHVQDVKASQSKIRKAVETSKRDKPNVQHQQQQDLQIGASLCATGIVLSWFIMRTMKR